MKFTSNELSKAIRFGLAFGVVATSGLVGTAVYAQDEKETTTTDTITVLGSRIKRTDIETSQPVFALEKADLQKTGLNTIGDVLQHLTSNGATLNTTINNGNTNGRTQVDLRNCGAQRTLVLVNGRRWVTDLSSTVDLSSIPLSMIERLEVLKDGASAVYGSDAICGVVNITTRDNYDGAEASAYWGENSHGDGRKQAYDFTIGSNGERANVAMNVSYTEQDMISSGDREISRVPLYGFDGNTSSPGRASTTSPFGRFNLGAPRGRVTLDPSKPGCLPNQVCAPSVGISDFRAYNFATDGYNFAPDNFILQPVQTKAVFVQGRYNITDNIRFKSNVLYSDRTSHAQLAAQPLTGFTASKDSIYNPFGKNIVGAQFRPTSIFRSYTADNPTWYFNGMFEGDFSLWDRNWSWDVGSIYTESKFTLARTGFFVTSQFLNAVGPSFIDGNGTPRCGTADAPIDACVPFNIFGGADGVTQEMADYVTANPHEFITKKQTSYAANISSELFELPAGPLGFAAGYEYRRESGLDEPDALSQTDNLLGDTPQKATKGGYSVDEFYVEFNIPLIKDAALAQILEFNIADRYSDYSNFGHTSNPKFGFRWKPIDDLLFRGNWSKGFRAPSINELFAGEQTDFPQVSDPCSASNITATATVVANCKAAGVPVDYQQQNAQINTTTGGNPNLTPEKATTTTLGLVYSPSYLEGLDLYLDWYKIKLTNSINTPVAQSVVDNCYSGRDVAQCAYIVRDLTGAIDGNPGEIIHMLNPTYNSGRLEVKGYDFSADYKFETENWGKFRLNTDNAYITRYYNEVLDDTFRAAGKDPNENQIGEEIPGSQTGGLWRLRSTFTVDWTYGDWGATAQAQYYSKLHEDCSGVTDTADGLGKPELRNLCSEPDRVVDVDGVPTAMPRNTMSSTWYFDLQGRWTAPWNATISAGIQNLFDKDPPKCFSCFANTMDAAYRTPGRFWYLSYDQKF